MCAATRRWLAALALFAAACGHAAGSVTLTLELPNPRIGSGAHFFAGDMPVVWTFENHSRTKSATICSCTADTIRFDVWREGVALAPAAATWHFSDDPRAQWKDQLVTLRPGERRAFRSEAPDFVVVSVDGHYDPQLQQFDLQPGRHSLRVRYRYPGPSFQRPNVVRQELISNTVRFWVR